jgi:DMSO/TMAO reductase YedYZ molybdopterin-dependent catalytic subunit
MHPRPDRAAPLTGPAAEAAMRRLTRRGFLAGGLAALAGAGGWAWLTTRAEEDGVPWPLRCVLGLDERLARAAYSAGRLAPTFPRGQAREPRVNGHIGLGGHADAARWRIQLLDPERDAALLELPLDALAGLPRAEMVTELKCVEGWSEVVHWGGVRFADFAARFAPPGKPAHRYEYVSLATPDGGYYVGLDMASALHPQTLLCDMMSGAPLPAEHGGPLRLVTTLKYGVKNIKQVGRIRFTDRRPADYWAERGYDWYLGL